MIEQKTSQVAEILQRIHQQRLLTEHPNYPSLEREKVTIKPRTKYLAVDIGDSGAWLVERATGEIFNIRGYGSPDKNKKKKADIGNILTVDPAVMYAKRWNYLR